VKPRNTQKASLWSMIRNCHMPNMKQKSYNIDRGQVLLIRMKRNAEKLLTPSTPTSTVVTYLYVALIQHSKPLY
jgi:hypothetical protein